MHPATTPVFEVVEPSPSDRTHGEDVRHTPSTYPSRTRPRRALLRCRESLCQALLALAILTPVGLTGCGGPKLAESREAVFAQAVEASLEEDYTLAAAAANDYLKGSGVEDPRYDRALRILAQSAEELGLSYAASLWYLEIARSRRDTTLANQAIAGLERLTRNYQLDEETIARGFLGTSEITGLDDEAQAFVDYYQGLNSLQKGLDQWAIEQFDQIPQESPYRARATYALIIRALAGGELEGAKQALIDLRSARNVEESLRLDIERTLARIAFEEGRWRDAQEAYLTLRKSAPDDPELLLEMAWTHYYLGEYQRALGLLVALDAPAYAGLIAPERYLLEALSLRKLCQFEPARKAAVRLRSRHGDAIDDLYEGTPLLESAPLRAAARLRQEGRQVGDWRARVEAEARMLEDYERKLGPELTTALQALYARGQAEAKRREDAELGDVMAVVAGELLGAEEGVRLILHELGVALLRGRRRGDGAPAIDGVTSIDEQDQIAYLFVDEFWTDELDDIVVRMEDRCIE